MLKTSLHINKIILSAISILLFTTNIYAQKDSTAESIDNTDIQQQLENIAENTENEETDFTNLLDELIYFKQHKINLNKTQKDELQQLQLLNDVQINNLLKHIEKNGKLITIYELQGITGFDLQTINRLLPYIKVENNLSQPHFTLKEMFRNGNHQVLLRYAQIIEEQKGFSSIDSAQLFDNKNSRYIGSPQKLYARYRFTYGTNISWGITAEKDQGELFFKQNQQHNYDWYKKELNGKQKTGFDFYSAHLFVRNIKFIRTIAIGDYQATFGQGLTCWSGLAFGKSADVLNVKKSAAGLRPYTSVDENLFLRGGAATFGIKKFETTVFYSNKKIDASIADTLDNGEIASISSLQETGYHSTLSELKNKDAITQTIYGANAAYKSRAFSMGITAVNYRLSAELNRNLNINNQFEFNGKQNTNIGIDYNWVFKNFNFFGEQAMSKNGGLAFVNGVMISLDPRLTFTALYRNYQRNYQNLISNGFAENTVAINEKGVFMGIVAKPTNTITLTGYFDRFEFPWLRYLTDAPSYGYDYLAQINFTPNKKFDAYFRIRSRDKFRNISSEAEEDIDYITHVKQTNYRFNLSYSVFPSIKLKNRVELIDYNREFESTKKGYLIYQDIIYNKLGSPLSVTLRYAIFETDNYDSRIYAYENDVVGSYSIPAYYYKGSRFYAMVNYNITRKIELWVRYSQTYYANKNIISEGSLTEINGNTRSEIKAQVRLKF